MKQVMAVVSSEYRFSVRFCDYINKSGHIVFNAVPFHDTGDLEEFVKKHGVAIILCDENMIPDIKEGREFCGVRIVPLCGNASDEKKGKAVFKYQSAEEIIREIMEILSDIRFSAGIKISGRPVSVYSVYSPVSDEYKTYSALTAACIMSKNKRTLYVNFEEMPGFTKMIDAESERGLSEALYYLKQGELTAERIASVIYSSGPLQYIPPVHTADDLSMIGGEDCVNLIRALFAGSSYDTVIADLPPNLSMASDVFDVSESIFVPCCKGGQDIRMRAFLENLKRSGKDAVLEKLRMIDIPDEAFPDRESFGHGFTSALLYGRPGDIISEAIEDENG